MSNVGIYLLIGMAWVALALALMGNPWHGSKWAFVLATILAIAAWPGFVLYTAFVIYKGKEHAHKP